MPGPERWLRILSLCTLVWAIGAVARAQMPQPVAVPAPSDPEFLSRFDFHLSAAALASGNDDFAWDAHFGGSFDIVDYVVGRASLIVDYQSGPAISLASSILIRATTRSSRRCRFDPVRPRSPRSFIISRG